MATWSLDAALETEEWNALSFSDIPVAMCETGAFKDFFSTPEVAASEIVQLEVSTPYLRTRL